MTVQYLVFNHIQSVINISCNLTIHNKGIIKNCIVYFLTQNLKCYQNMTSYYMYMYT